MMTNSCISSHLRASSICKIQPIDSRIPHHLFQIQVRLLSTWNLICQQISLVNGSFLISCAAAAAPEVGRALSLLSTNSWDSCEPESIPLHHQTILQPPIIHAGVPLSSSSDFWLSHPHIPTNANFQEIQLFKTPYDANFYSNVLNWPLLPINSFLR